MSKSIAISNAIMDRININELSIIDRTQTPIIVAIIDRITNQVMFAITDCIKNPIWLTAPTSTTCDH